MERRESLPGFEKAIVAARSPRLRRLGAVLKIEGGGSESGKAPGCVWTESSAGSDRVQQAGKSDRAILLRAAQEIPANQRE